MNESAVNNITEEVSSMMRNYEEGVLDLGESEFTPLFAYAFSLKNTDLDSMKELVDNHTAVVKIEDGKVAIVDFAENCKYILPVPC